MSLVAHMIPLQNLMAPSPGASSPQFMNEFLQYSASPAKKKRVSLSNPDMSKTMTTKSFPLTFLGCWLDVTIIDISKDVLLLQNTFLNCNFVIQTENNPGMSGSDKVRTFFHGISRIKILFARE